MPARVTYWTGTWSPGREAISNEIEALRRLEAPAAPVVSFSSGQRSHFWPEGRVLRLSSSRWLLLRVLAPAIEALGDVSHAFGSIDSWHLLRSLGRRPLLFTVVIPGPALERSLYDKVTLFAAESQRLADRLVRAGVPANRIRVVCPGVDLKRFHPLPAPPHDPFTLLFASAPADPDEFEARGIPLMIELARLRPDIRVRLQWRAWGSSALQLKALARLSPPPNVEVVVEATDMVAAYQRAHAMICCFETGFGKSFPNSIVEGLASGRPALVADTCDIADVIAETGAGLVRQRSATALASAIDELQREAGSYAVAARRTAEKMFDLEDMAKTYGAFYRALADDAKGHG